MTATADHYREHLIAIEPLGPDFLSMLTELARGMVDDTPGTYDGLGPSYYRSLSPSPIDVMDAWGLPHDLACVVKYVARNGRKPGELAERDLTKAIWYLRHAIIRIGRERALATAPTDPCPPPAPSTLGERMAAAGWAMREAIEVDDVPDDRRTERGT